MPNLIVSIPNRETARSKSPVVARHPPYHRLYRRMQYPVCCLMIILTPHGHTETVAA